MENVELDEVSIFAVVIDGPTSGGEVEREGGSFYKQNKNKTRQKDKFG